MPESGEGEEEEMEVSYGRVQEVLGNHMAPSQHGDMETQGHGDELRFWRRMGTEFEIDKTTGGNVEERRKRTANRMLVTTRANERQRRAKEMKLTDSTSHTILHCQIYIGISFFFDSITLLHVKLDSLSIFCNYFRVRDGLMFIMFIKLSFHEQLGYGFALEIELEETHLKI
ncbi:hypothetical protein SLE2022_221120 [Rubroshorea leprosula]